MRKGSHFSITKGKSDYFHIVVVAALGIFFVFATFALVMKFNAETAIESLRDNSVPTSRKVSLILTTPNSEVALGSSFPVEVILQTGLPVTGVDVVMQYDPRYLALEKQSAETQDEVGYLDTRLSVFDIFPFANFKSKSIEEKIFSFAALAKPLKKFKGSGAVASLRFKALQRGDTEISIISKPGSGEDSNVAYIGRDVLSYAGKLTVRIK